MEHPTQPFDKAEAYDFHKYLSGKEAEPFDFAARWQALDEAGRLVASLAGEDPALADGDFVARIESGPPHRKQLAERYLDDLSAIMEPGLSALLYVCEHGGEPRAPAAALWREFTLAWAALLALAPPNED